MFPGVAFITAGFVQAQYISCQKDQFTLTTFSMFCLEKNLFGLIGQIRMLVKKCKMCDLICRMNKDYVWLWLNHI